MRAVLVHNPTAGTGSHSADALTTLLREAGYSVTACSTKNREYKTALDNHADLILIAGGDGSITKVIRRLSNYDIPIAILPLGTANNIARSLGIEGDPGALLECIRKHTTHPFDIGIVTGPWGKRRFAEGVGVGLFAEWMQAGSNKPPAAERTKIGRERLRGALVRETPRRWTITVDGHELAREVCFVEVLNTRYIGPALPIGPSSAPGDRLFDVVYLLPEKRADMLSWLENPERTPSPFLVRQGRKIILQWDSGHLHIDDRTWAPPEKPTRLKIKLERKELSICVPPPLASSQGHGAANRRATG
jgi:diacylglycerol kinase (ATP)